MVSLPVRFHLGLKHGAAFSFVKSEAFHTKSIPMKDAGKFSFARAALNSRAASATPLSEVGHIMAEIAAVPFAEFFPFQPETIFSKASRCALNLSRATTPPARSTIASTPSPLLVGVPEPGGEMGVHRRAPPSLTTLSAFAGARRRCPRHGLPKFQERPFLSEPIVSVVMRGMHVVLRMRENGEAIFARHAKRRQPRRDGPSKIVWRRVGALDRRLRPAVP